MSTLLRKVGVGFQKSVLGHSEIDAGNYFLLVSKATKRTQLEFLLIELIYIIYTSHNLFFKFCFCCKKKKRGILLRVKYAFIIIRLSEDVD